MDQQLMEMIRDRFDAVDASLSRAEKAFEKHAKDDADYWKILTEQQEQFKTIKRIFWGAVSILGVIGTWMGLRH